MRNNAHQALKNGEVDTRTDDLLAHVYPNSNFKQQNASPISKQNNEMPAGLSTSSLQNGHHETNKQEQQFMTRDAFEQHRQFLQNYKKERGEEIRIIRERFFASKFSPEACLEQQSQEQQQQEEQAEELVQKQQSNPIYEAVSQKLQQIHKKLNMQILCQPEHSQNRKFRIFDGAVNTKNDLERVAKQKRFIRSQTEKYEYKEPEMPHRNLMPLKYRLNTQSLSDQADLCKKARDFIQKVHRQQQNLLGKQIVRKKREEFKKLAGLKEEMSKVQELQEIKRQDRRQKAEQNLQVMREKLKINKIVNRNNIEQLRKVLAQKQQRLEDIQQNFKDSSSFESRFRKGRSSTQMQAKTTSISEYTPIQRYSDPSAKDAEPGVSIDKLKRLKDKESNVRAKLKIAIKKHRLTRPTQYKESSLDRNAQDQRLKTDYIENSSFLRKKDMPGDQEKDFVDSEFVLSSRGQTNQDNARGDSIPLVESQKIQPRVIQEQDSVDLEKNTSSFGNEESKRGSQVKKYPKTSLQ